MWPPLNPPLNHWVGRRVWLVGASSGIGAACARALTRAGATVVVSARNEATLAALCDTLGPQAMAVPLDVTDRQAVDAAARRVLALGGVDLVVYCAAVYTPMRASSLDAEALQIHVAVNFQGALNVLTAVLPELRAQGHGHLSWVASVAGYTGLPHSLAYGPSKAALIHLAEILYLDLHPQGLGVSVVNPGFVATRLTARNNFHMPALLTPDQAAAAMLEGWARGDFEIHFPKRFTLAMQVLRSLPYRLRFALIRRITQT